MSSKKKSADDRSRGWCYTWNNPVLDYSTESYGLLKLFGDAIYHICQLERGNSGTLHVQGFIYYKNAVHFNTVKSQLRGAHFEKARGSVEDNIKYCSKAEGRVGGPFIRGSRPQQGQRTDLKDAINDIRSGKSMRDISDLHPEVYVRNHKGLQAFKIQRSLARNFKSHVIVFFGPTGFGKSYLAHRKCGPSVYVKTGMDRDWETS